MKIGKVNIILIDLTFTTKPNSLLSVFNALITHGTICALSILLQF